MRITFCLPNMVNSPVGGFKIIYEYANRLSQTDIVTIVYDCSSFMKRYEALYSTTWIKKLIRLIRYPRSKWFKFSTRVRFIYAYNGFNNSTIPEGDYIFATSYETAKPVLDLSSKKGTKCYFVQGYENWNVSNQDVNETYSYGFKVFVVSKWLKERVDKFSDEEATLIQNPIDVETYKIMRAQSDRIIHSVGLLYHDAENKGIKYALKTLALLKARYTDLSVEMFGTCSRPKDLPKWINYTKNASIKRTIEIYNNVQVFLCASVEEGFGLTGLEAMACGAVLVSTDYKGVFEYAQNEANALLSPVKDIEMLASNVSRVFEDEKLRIRLSENGVKSARDFNWNKAVNKLRDCLGYR